MKENMDMMIRQKIQKEQVAIPEHYFKKINLTLQSLPEKVAENKKNSAKIRFKHVVPVAAALCLLISGTVYAAVNYVQQRMLSMDENEKKEMADYTRKSEQDIDTYSRELTEDEKERREALLYEYQHQGKFPENGLEIVDTKEMVKEGALVFITEESMFVLPERTLTDEELLQIIDFYYKRDYSLMASKEDMPSAAMTVNDEVKKNVIEQIKTMINTIYQVETDNLETSVEADVNGMYRIEISDAGQKRFSALYDLESERVVEIGAVSSVEATSEKRKSEKEYFVEVGKGLAETIKKLDSSAAIEAMYCDYNITEDEMLARGIVSYICRLENGGCYVVKYDLAADQVADLFMTPYQEYQRTIDDNAKKQAARGVQRIRMDIEVR